MSTRKPRRVPTYKVRRTQKQANDILLSCIGTERERGVDDAEWDRLLEAQEPIFLPAFATFSPAPSSAGKARPSAEPMAAHLVLEVDRGAFMRLASEAARRMYSYRWSNDPESMPKPVPAGWRRFSAAVAMLLKGLS